MLRTLEIRDMLIIDRLDLAFRPGLNVLTGETGAGKSILLEALGFVLGWRGRAELVRTGAEQGEVLAEFDLSPGHPARHVLAEAGLPVEDTLILRRTNGVDGRKTAFVNDRRASGAVLRQLSATLVELHGQQDDRGLLDPREHRRFLDTFGRLGPQIEALRDDWTALSRLRRTVADAEAAREERETEEAYLRHAIDEITALDPREGEEDELDAKRRLMQRAEKIGEDISRAADVLGSGGAEGSLATAMRWLEGVSEAADGRLDGALDALSRTMIELDDATACIRDCLEALQFEPAALEQAEERLFALRALARKHQVQADALAEHGTTLSERLATLEGTEADLARDQKALKVAEARYAEKAAALSAARAEAARSLDAAVRGELAPLKMDRAHFETTITPADPGPEGVDAVAFTVATNPGAPAGPLARIASGGELSRFLLALKVCLTRDSDGLTLIFDEIDRGVGGATADAVGRRLAALADPGQVLVVTHSPQVAALGAHHWRVEKQVTDGQTRTSVIPLSLDERTDEIARMLAGDVITAEARAAARSLLNG
ncbi:DNA replication and repair protein RecN [Poseidonocella pacifica]|uniref:DNA repair protein RecN n=1 Tax=Poseidonocella pacifica TaxID=871651 RepID=A0A1I0VUV1_9RHOB|nr:DNA repair protein RecN [Poseidonocella pacifica]SFA80092.1 DNA replication and repair protein RecN [Poseidonocella pacifica]